MKAKRRMKYRHRIVRNLAYLLLAPVARLKYGKKMLETLKNIADTVVNNVYLEEYLTEMFTLPPHG